MLRKVRYCIKKNLGEVVDSFFAGSLLYRIERRRAERELAPTLDAHGDTSIEAQRLTDHFKAVGFATRYWRTASPELMAVIESAKKQGPSEADLRILNLNLELSTQGDHLTIHTPWMVWPITVAMIAVVLTGFLMFIAMAATAPAASSLKIAVILGVLIVFATLYRGWSLFASRAIAAGTRLRKHLAERMKTASVTPIHRARR